MSKLILNYLVYRYDRNATVPTQCHNGTFSWNYPSGDYKLIFPNPNGRRTSVCLKDFIGGEIYDIHDITGKLYIPMEINDREVNTLPNSRSGNCPFAFAASVFDKYTRVTKNSGISKVKCKQ